MPLSDTFGFFLQMMIVAVCSMALLHFVATPSAQGKRASRDDGSTRSLRERVADDA